MANRFTARMRRVIDERGTSLERLTRETAEAEAERVAIDQEIKRYEAVARRMLELHNQGVVGWSCDPVAMEIRYGDGRVEPIESENG